MNRLFILLFAICFSASSYGQDAETLRKAEAGHVRSQYWIAEAYRLGSDGAPKDDEKYVYWLKKAANGGNANAQNDLGRLYKNGEYGVPKDESLYIKWAKKAAFNGCCSACFSLGLYYEDEDKQEAIYWFKKGMDVWWKTYGEEEEFCAERLRKLGIYYHPEENINHSNSSSTNTSSNSSSTSTSSNSSNNSTPTRQLQPVQEWIPCIGCGGTGLCTYCQGKGKRWYGNSYENCITCHGNMYCQQCYGKKGYYQTVYR